MPTLLEHANLMVGSIEESVRFLTTAFPEFKIRGSGVFQDRPWSHVGTNDIYIAINEVGDQRAEASSLNHIGFAVDDVDALAERLLAAGYREGMVVPEHPYRKRRYFHDADDLEWEFVEYLTDDPAKRHEYSE